MQIAPTLCRVARILCRNLGKHCMQKICCVHGLNRGDVLRARCTVYVSPQKGIVATDYASCNGESLPQIPLSKANLAKQTRKLTENHWARTKLSTATKIEIIIQSCVGWEMMKPRRQRIEQNSVEQNWNQSRKYAILCLFLWTKNNNVLGLMRQLLLHIFVCCC